VIPPKPQTPLAPQAAGLSTAEDTPAPPATPVTPAPAPAPAPPPPPFVATLQQMLLAGGSSSSPGRLSSELSTLVTLSTHFQREGGGCGQAGSRGKPKKASGFEEHHRRLKDELERA